MVETPRDMRRAERLDLVLPARCRSRTGFVNTVVMTDISAEGCRIEGFGLTLHQDDLVVIQPQCLEGICGTVRWTNGHKAGIEFANPLYAPVVEHLSREYSTFLKPVVEGPSCQRLAA